MKIKSALVFFFCITVANSQNVQINLADKFKTNSIQSINREIALTEDGTAVKMNAQPGDGLGMVKGVFFSKGIIDLEIKGENNPGKSFVGVAFNIQNDSTFEAIYFRPFNFVAEEAIRRAHMVQYINHPDNTWRALRETRTGEFENEIKNPPDPDDWFHARIVVDDDRVSVYVNDAQTPSLEVERLDTHKSDRIAVWTGFNSAGWFRSITISQLQ